MDPDIDDDDEIQATSGFAYRLEEMPFDCPVCGDVVAVHDIFHHIASEHPTYLVAWAAFAMPHMNVDDILQWATYHIQQEHGEVDDYEYLTELCETIGNHYVGVDDIEKVTSVSVNETNDPCPICLESMIDSLYSRKLNACSHTYCGPCIEKWFETHKQCPVCKVDVCEANACEANACEAHISSISISDSASDAPEPTVDSASASDP